MLIKNKFERDNSMKNKFIIITFFVIVSFATVSFGATFKGKVIDADTKEPIEGAVVVASWSEERATVTGPTSRSKDVKETLTDKNGEWEVKGPKGGEVGNVKSIFSFLTGMYFTNPPVFIVFKPGYCSYPAGLGIDACKGKIRTYNLTNSETIGEIVELPKLTIRDRETLSRNIPFISAGDINELPAFNKLFNQDMGYEK